MPPARLWKSIAQLGAVILASLMVPGAVCRWTMRSGPDAAGTPVQKTGPSQGRRTALIVPDAERSKLHQQRPDWIIIGNSMANTRLDNARLAAISGRRPRKLALGGSQSAIWFLLMKDIVAGSGAKPEWVTVFFRETDLTWPEFRTTGANVEVAAAMNGTSQPEWKAVMEWRTREARTGWNGISSAASDALGQLLEGDKLRAWARGKMQKTAFNFTEFGASVPYGLRRLELNDTFSPARLRHDLGTDMAAAGGADASWALGDVGEYDVGPTHFDPSPAASFLPHMLALAEQHGFKLHFHRVRRRAQADRQTPDSALMASYMQDLRSWLESRHCVLTDEYRDASITPDLYADGDHVSSEPGPQQRYMENFWQRVRPFIGEAAPSTKPRRKAQ